MDSICTHYCVPENLVVLTPAKLETIRELGWTAKDYERTYVSTQIVVNSSVAVYVPEFSYYKRRYQDVDFMTLQVYILEFAAVHKLCYFRPINSILIFEDWTHKLNKTHLDFIQQNIGSMEYGGHRLVLPEITPNVTVTTLSFNCFKLQTEYKSDIVKYVQHLSRFCFRSSYIEARFALKEINIYGILQALMLMDFRTLNSYTSVQALGFQPFAENTAIFQLSSQLKKPSELHTLKISSLQCKSVAAFLHGLTELKHLHVHQSKLCGCTCDLLHHIRQMKRLVTLDISDSEVEVQEIVNALPLFIYIQELHLRNVSLTDNDVSIISIALKNLRSLKSLSLSSESMTDASVKTLVSALNSPYHRNFHSLYLSYNYVGGNKDDFLTLAQLTGLRSLRIEPLKEFKNIHEIVKVFTPLTELKHIQFTMYTKKTRAQCHDDNDWMLLMEAKDRLIEAVNNLTGLQYLAFDDIYLLSIDIPFFDDLAEPNINSSAFPLNILI